jgi:hypothetical protein
MKQFSKLLVAVILVATAATASATPSTTFWTPATTYVQPYAIPHITYDTYVAEKAGFQNDYGLTIGILPFEKLQAEIGIDSLMPGLVKNNLLLNAKVGVPEGAFGEWQPGISGGIYGLGFEKDISNFDILHLEVGKTFPVIGNVVLGGYYGIGADLLGSDGKKTQGGVMAAWTSPDVVLNLPGLNKINFIADVQSGKNAFGAWGVGVGLYFTPAIDILTGPVFFLDKDTTTMLGGPGISAFASRPDMLWTIQLDVDMDLRPAAKK